MANECIPLYRPGADVTCVTTGAVTGKTFVAQSAALTTGLISVATATAAGAVFGVAAYDAASGARVAVIRGKNRKYATCSGALLQSVGFSEGEIRLCHFSSSLRPERSECSSSVVEGQGPKI